MKQDAERDSIPRGEDIVYTYANLPSSSPLLKYFVEAVAFNWIPYLEDSETAKQSSNLPGAFTQAVMTIALNRAAAPEKFFKPDYEEEPCKYHEHGDTTEERVCRSAHKSKKLLEELRRRAHRNYRKGKLPMVP